MKNNFKEDELIIYQNGDMFEIGRIKRLTENGAFVYYHSGDTAAKTPFDCMHKLQNSHCIPFTILGGKSQWIPVSERLPENNEFVLVTYNHNGKNIVDFLRFNLPCRWEESFGEYEIEDVIAWMPLPEPYEE